MPFITKYQGFCGDQSDPFNTLSAAVSEAQKCIDIERSMCGVNDGEWSEIVTDIAVVDANTENAIYQAELVEDESGLWDAVLVDVAPETTLNLTLKKKWFEMIRTGFKKHEYREIKDYWIKRLEGKPFNKIKFVNGYGASKPNFTIELFEITVGAGLEEWGAPNDKAVFVLPLGNILEGS